MPILRFRLFGFPVQVLPGYWLLTAILSFMMGRPTLASGLTMMVLMMVSILAHELGHGLAARAFGMPAQITLHAMGGATTFPGGGHLTRMRDIAISLAGPGAGFLLAFVGWRLMHVVPDPESGGSEHLAAALQTLVVINALWSATNLIPVIPFDGGRILAAALGPERRFMAACLSLGVGIAAGIGFAYLGQPLAAVLFASSAVSSFLQAQQERKAEPVVVLPSVPDALSQARAALHAEDWRRSEELSHAILRGVASPEQRKTALETLLWARLGAGDARGARTLIVPLPAGSLDPYLVAAVHDAAGYPEDARQILVAARAAGDTRTELTALLVRVLLTLGKGAAAANLTREIIHALSPAEVERVIAEATQAGAREEAERLRGELPSQG
jgi:Zn-dependent protease